MLFLIKPTGTFPGRKPGKDACFCTFLIAFSTFDS